MANDTVAGGVELSGGQPREQGATAEAGYLGGLPSFFELAARDAVAAGYMSQEGFERVMSALERARE